MEVNMDFDLFIGDGFNVNEDLLTNLHKDEQDLLRSIMASGHYTEKGLDISKFLREDLSIDLEKLELAVITLVHAMEINHEEDVTLTVFGLEDYYSFRGIVENEKQRKEEKNFILIFISKIALNESIRDTFKVVLSDEIQANNYS